MILRRPFCRIVSFCCIGDEDEPAGTEEKVGSWLVVSIDSETRVLAGVLADREAAAGAELIPWAFSSVVLVSFSS